MKRITFLFLLLITFYIFSCQNGEEKPVANNVESTGYLLDIEDLPDYERDIDHAGLISGLDRGSLHRGMIIYRNTCFSCHGDEEQPGSLPNSIKFWKETFKNGSDPLALYNTLTRGFGQMAPQGQLVPSQKYEVIHFIREEFIKENNPEEYVEIDTAYIESLPKGSNKGPKPTPYQPWADMDYGNWMNRCFEMSDEFAPPKVITTRNAPLKNEDYSKVNFAYKGIAMRLDEGEGGISKGNTFAMFDHDMLRFVGAWTGKGFIDWDDILLNDKHNIYPRTVGKRQFANPITPGWANPETGSFEDPRFLGADGRPFGPLPRKWAHYKGLYRYEDRIVIKYTVGGTEVLETYDLEQAGEQPIISRTLTIGVMDTPQKLRVAPDSVSVALLGGAADLRNEDGYNILEIPSSKSVVTQVKLLMTRQSKSDLEAFAQTASPPQDLREFTKGSPAKYDKNVLTSNIIKGNEEDPYAVDVFVLPKPNMWNARMRLSGIDFIEGGKEAIVCTVDGEVWRLEGIAQSEGNIKWHRIATGMFQPLGIKYHNGDIYVSNRDQITILRDLNGDGETDYYESFNSDHQVTEHFHEFAMGLQTDKEGNFYYAKSGRHARTSLVPQHGTLIKVSPDGKTSEILANGFRAANGICLNPDGSFYVTDQEGYWNPMNRINRVTKGGFYGNMWGYGAPADTSDAAMIQPMCWIDSKYDRSPAELLWAESDRWGPLNGSLLNLSYGYGKVFVVLPQKIKNEEQGGMVEMNIPEFSTGIMRARFNPIDGQFYGCGMAAWATSKLIQIGGLYRIRYTGKELNMPIEMEANAKGLKLTFSDPLDESSAINTSNFEINTWDLKRTARYGSDRYNTKNLEIESIRLEDDGKTLHISIPEIKPTWVMEIIYNLKSESGKAFEGAIQNTIYELPGEVG